MYFVSKRWNFSDVSVKPDYLNVQFKTMVNHEYKSKYFNLYFSNNILPIQKNRWIALVENIMGYCKIKIIIL